MGTAAELIGISGVDHIVTLKWFVCLTVSMVTTSKVTDLEKSLSTLLQDIKIELKEAA